MVRQGFAVGYFLRPGPLECIITRRQELLTPQIDLLCATTHSRFFFAHRPQIDMNKGLICLFWLATSYAFVNPRVRRSRFLNFRLFRPLARCEDWGVDAVRTSLLSL